ncbi:acetolactate synthase-1/2/3 large subunit [Inquilinus ginsengisoli]|uniref:Acetolactate synthase-1/2/3 large subunit n=1 Tax=Inquilinus ginsengisoli TaxID=363840 RepID=A0ABU1JP20_9PROT|nr:thiamine pyrophosphate-dependent enzyme [Inquilinus ginsengisoli]MDR6290365.1 acetolactate synthase-1/2/3 large subunit [Inquilinus ginsengisoli]
MDIHLTETVTGYESLVATLESWGIEVCAGVTGGGAIRFLEKLPPLHAGEDTADHNEPAGMRFLSLGEYASGFVPLGSYLASGRIGACIATTGAATKLLGCGLSDAKLHDIPAVYIVPVSPDSTEGQCPLQDTSRHGSHMLAQLRAELPDGVFVLDDAATMERQLQQAHAQLKRCKPVVLVLDHGALKTRMAAAPHRAPPQPDPALASAEADAFADAFCRRIRGRRVVILAGEELARYPDAPQLTSRLCEALGAPIVWSINGANGVERGNRRGYGYISFGGNDAAIRLWQDIGADDVLLVLGACPDEYTVNLAPYAAGDTFVLTGLPDGYGQVEGGFGHRAGGACRQLVAPLDAALRSLLGRLEWQPPETLRAGPAPDDLNTRRPGGPRPGHADMASLFRALDARWRPNTIGFDDVCLAYKDRQYVVQRPHPHARFFSLYRGSAMGNVLGLAIGAKLAAPESHVVGFTGDGCFRLFAGYLAEARDLGILLFLLDNASYGIVEQGLHTIIPDAPPSHRHIRLARMDFAAMAGACGWRSASLRPDLANLDDILDAHHRGAVGSTLVTVPVDPGHILGINPRADNL